MQLATLPRAKALSNGGSGTQVRLISAGAGRDGTRPPGLIVSPMPWFLRVGGLPMLLLCRGAVVVPLVWRGSWTVIPSVPVSPGRTSRACHTPAHRQRLGASTAPGARRSLRVQ